MLNEPRKGVRSSTLAPNPRLYIYLLRFFFLPAFNLTELFETLRFLRALFIHLSVVAGRDQREHLDVALGKGQHHPFAGLPSRL